MRGGISVKRKSIMFVKLLGMLMTIGGMIASNWSNDKEQEEAIERLVDEKLKSRRDS